MVIFQIKILRRDKPPQRTTNTLFYWTTWKIQHIVLFTLEIISKKKEHACIHVREGYKIGIFANLVKGVGGWVRRKFS